MHHSFKRALAVLLSILLAAGNLGLTAFAEGPAAAASPSDVVTGFVQIDEDEYAIINDTGWQIFADSVNGGNSYSGCTVYLRTDINVSQKVGVVEGRYLSDPFSGVFDGNNHTIHVAITDTDNQGTAPFCYINGATIKNLNVQGSVTGTYHTAAIVGFSTGSGNRIENCTASATVDGGGGNVGGILGHAKDSSITIAGTIFSGLMVGSGPKGAILGWGDAGGDKHLHECLYLMAEGQDTANLDLAKMDEGSVTVSSCLKTCDAGSYGSRAYFSAPSDRICKSVRFHGVALYAAAETNVPSFIRYPGEPFPLEPVVTWLDTPLTPETDYSLTIEGVEGNIINHSGVYTLHFTGLGAYHGTQTAVVTILGSVPYLDADGETAYRTDYTFLTGSETEWSGWYVAEGTVDIGSRVTVSGEAHLILADGAALTIPKGVTVIETDSLTIYAQSTGDGMGALTIDGVGTYYAGIGGDSNCRPCGVITINGGFVEAAGGLYGAGIGGGSDVAGGKITVNGGEVTATGGQYSAGIGGGGYAAGGKTTIRGGTVTATGGQYGAGIGGGYEAAGGEITISGGRVTAKAGNLWLAGGIGPGFGFGYSNPGTLTMSLSRPDEFIQADSYSCYLKTYDRQKYLSVRVANGCYLKDSSGNLYSGELSHDTLDALEGVKLLYAAVFHTVSVAATQHGTVTASHTTAEQGTQITLTVSPEAGCVLTSLTVNGIDVTAEVSNGSYSFPMPDADVEVSAVFAVALEQEGDTYTIYRSEGWDMFCDLLANNPKGFFDGKTVVLGESISVSRMAGLSGRDFTGVFDGNGKTLRFTATAAESYCAPFRYVQGASADSKAVIRNLKVQAIIDGAGFRHPAGLIAMQTGYVDVRNCSVEATITDAVNTDGSLYPAGLVSQVGGSAVLTVSGCSVTGTISTDSKYAGGLIGVIQGSASMENSVCGVTINSSTNGDGTHGGLVGLNNGGCTLSIEGCVFNGSLLGENTNRVGGFVGWSGGSTTISDSLFAPAELSVQAEGSATLARNGATITNCYYTRTLGEAQGKQVHRVSADEGVTLDFGASAAEYSFSGITAYAPGIRYGGIFYAGEGDALTFTVIPPHGYALDVLHVNGVDVTAEVSNNSYSFTMPGADAAVSATFVAWLEEEGDSYTINAAEGWDAFCDLLANNPKGYFDSKTVVLARSISVSRMAGSEGRDFTGVFDGGGKTLTFTATAAENYCAPFRYVQGASADSKAVIRNLKVKSVIDGAGFRHPAGLIAIQTGYVEIRDCDVELTITDMKTTDGTLYPAGLVSQVAGSAVLTVSGCAVTGTISTDAKYAGGLIGIIQGSASMENSVSGVTIDSAVSGDGTHGGLVGVNNGGASLTIEGCVFNGCLLGENTNKVGGFVGWGAGSTSISDSLFAPAELSVQDEGSAAFARNGATLSNCYYTQALGEVQGKQAYAVSAGEDVTLGLAGALSVYELSGLTVSDAHVGLQYGDVIYAAAGEELSIRLSCVFPGHGGYFVNAGTLSGTENPYTLAMPAQDVRVDALTDLPFVDVEREKYYFNAVLWAFYHEPPITTGVSEISFGPSLNCTRAQVVTFLWKAAGAPAPLSTESPFLDVQPDAYYCQAVLWALEQGITAGTDAEHFSPDNVCTRAEAVTFLYAWQGRPAVDSQADKGFADVSPDDYYHDAVAWAVSHGVTAGTDATHFSPSANCTRSQMLTFLFRAAGNAN